MEPQKLTITFDLNALNLTQLAALAAIVSDDKAQSVIQSAMDALSGPESTNAEFWRVSNLINGEAVQS